MQLGGHQRPGERGIGVAIDQDPVRPFALEHVFQSYQHTAGLFAMPTATNAERVVWLDHAKLVEKDVRHVGVEMLAGMHKNLTDLRYAAKRRRHGRGLDELGPGADHGADFQLCHVIQVQEMRAF